MERLAKTEKKDTVLSEGTGKLRYKLSRCSTQSECISSRGTDICDFMGPPVLELDIEGMAWKVLISHLGSRSYAPVWFVGPSQDCGFSTGAEHKPGVLSTWTQSGPRRAWGLLLSSTVGSEQHRILDSWVQPATQ